LIDSNASEEVLMDFYKKMETYMQQLPCGCAEHAASEGSLGMSGAVHATLYEVLRSNPGNIKLNTLDEKRRKKILVNIESLNSWISNNTEFNESKQHDIVKELQKISRSLRQMATDVRHAPGDIVPTGSRLSLSLCFQAQPSLPDVFLWMISDSKRVAYARLSPEDILFNQCYGERGLQNGRVQSLFLKVRVLLVDVVVVQPVRVCSQTPRVTDKPLKTTSNGKVQIFLWLGIEEYQPYLFKQLPTGFDIPPLPLNKSTRFLQYTCELRC
jgi:hypothetical protein